MAKFCLKKPSKRVEARKRYKIEKKVREHNRKLRKEAKKNLKKKPKMVVIPNQCPFKEDILKEIDEIKKQHEEEKRKAREASREAFTNGGLKSLVSQTDSEEKKHDNEFMESETSKDGRGVIKKQESLLKTNYNEIKKVISTSDIILEVVDARDPLGTRCKQIEETVYSAKGNKRLVIVLNKADLITRENLDQWLKYIRQSVPAIAFNASKQEKTKLLRKKEIVNDEPAGQNETCFGAESLLALLTNYCKNSTSNKSSIRVGIVGLTNVGKSSIINYLKKSEVCNIGNAPGVTKEMQVVQLDSKIKLIDSPGIFFSTSEDEAEQNSVALKNLVKVQAVKHPFTVACSILKHISTQKLMETYDVLEFSTPEEFLARKAARMGRYKKGGAPDVRAAAQSILEDWNSGKIRYYTTPPEKPIRQLSPEIFSQIAKEFDLNKIIEEEKIALDNFSSDEGVILNPILINSSGPVNSAVKNEAVKQTRIKLQKIKNLKKTAESKQMTVIPASKNIEIDDKLDRVKKIQLKKQKKEAARKAKQAAVSVDQPTDAKTGESDDYDFKTDFK